ncbi:hypothetical protein Tco_1302919 [Tanacetum coccineum]
MTEAQQGNKNLETTQEQVVEDAHVTISTVPKKTKVPVTSSSRSSDLASKFLNFSDIPQTNAEIVSPLDVHRGRKDKDKDEDPSAGSDRGLKKRKLSKDAEPTTKPKNKDSTSDLPQDQEGILEFNLSVLLGPAFRLLKGTRSSYAELEYDFEECYKALSEKLDWENPEGGDYPFDLSKPLLLITRGNRQRTKAAQYDLPGIEDMVPNIWSPVKVAYDRYALWGIAHWREQHKSFYAFARGMQRIMAVTHVSVMRKHGYGYLEEIVMRRADNALYRFKEGDFPRLWINDIEDMLLLVKRVKDLQLGVKSYQKKINVTNPDTTRPDLIKRHLYTPYKEPQGFIYVDDHKRNRLMRSDELYKFSDGTLTRLLSSLEDITKNIDMEYLPKRRWSTLEKKRANFMIKDINKLLKERRMKRSLEKFVGGRLYGTDLKLLQRTI